MFEIIDGGVTAPKGFKASFAEAGIKYKNRPDMALIYSEEPCTVAGTFTTNVVKAAPVKWDMRVVKDSPSVQTVIVNSGIANAATGEQGLKICEETAEYLADKLGIDKNSVLIGSTGVIGMQIDMDKVRNGIDMLVPSLSASREAAAGAERAIMTTDTVPKEVAVKAVIGGKEVTIGAMSKGSGMIHPNMCTMLGYVMTDCNISKEMLTKALKTDVVNTFNMITVDGDTSTNDTLILMANGMAGNEEITSEGDDFDAFVECLHYVNTTLARKMARDGEGATTLFTCTINTADTVENARILAKSVVGSSLCKAAIYGNDANFGRFLCAIGYSGVSFDPDKVVLTMKSSQGELKIFDHGEPLPFDEEYATSILKQEEVIIEIEMNMGSQSATAWGCDLTYDYVKINADYRS